MTAEELLRLPPGQAVNTFPDRQPWQPRNMEEENRRMIETANRDIEAQIAKAKRQSEEFTNALEVRQRDFERRIIAVSRSDQMVHVLTAPTMSNGRPVQVTASNGLPAVRFAAPAIPDPVVLKNCAQNSGGSFEAFERCAMQSALPSQFRLAKDCIDRYQNDLVRAGVCSSGRQDMADAYNQFTKARDCFEKAGRDETKLAGCIADGLPGQAAYYGRCLVSNQTLSSTALCALGPSLTPEQQILLSCAVTTGGQPHAYIACAGGQMVSREIGKCWANGIAKEGGCFGPNSEYRQLVNKVDDAVAGAVGRNSAVYQGWALAKNGVIAPGENHFVIHNLNNALADVRAGQLGENNEITKATRAINNVFGGVGGAVKKIFGF